MSGLCMGLCIIFNLRILRHMPHAVDYMFDKKNNVSNYVRRRLCRRLRIKQ